MCESVLVGQRGQLSPQPCANRQNISHTTTSPSRARLSHLPRVAPVIRYPRADPSQARTRLLHPTTRPSRLAHDTCTSNRKLPRMDFIQGKPRRYAYCHLLASQCTMLTCTARLRSAYPALPPTLLCKPPPPTPHNLLRHLAHPDHAPLASPQQTHHTARCRLHPRPARHILHLAQDPGHDVPSRHLLGKPGFASGFLGRDSRRGLLGIQQGA